MTAKIHALPDIIERPGELSDDGLALMFAETHQDQLRYVAAFKTWMRWDRTRWRPDDTLWAWDEVRKICRAAAATASDGKMKKAVASANTVAGAEKLSRTDRRLAATVSQWDADAWLLNTPSGVIDLRTGAMHDHRREDYITKITGADFGGKCPTWDAFLHRITGGDTQLQSFLARMVGYCLTGMTREHAIFFIFGLGANGKTIFSETIARVLGDYAMPAPIAMFMSSRIQAHSTDVAGLQGARLVTASEIDAGQTLDEAKVKYLTGGETVSARKMRTDNIAFVPQFKVLMSGNSKPRLRSSNEAIRRRLHIIPFAVTIPEHERDPHLAEKLRAEWGGILAWAVEGCREWQDWGLMPPDTVRAATDEYLDNEDNHSNWVKVALALDPNAQVRSAEAFQAWKAYAIAANEEVGSQKDFLERCEAIGLKHKHTKSGNVVVGARLLQIDQGNQ
jgi:putative DNA primase/helicase